MCYPSVSCSSAEEGGSKRLQALQKQGMECGQEPEPQALRESSADEGGSTTLGLDRIHAMFFKHKV